MTKNEAWIWAVAYAVPAGSLYEKAILRALSRANGNVIDALKLMTKVGLWGDEKQEGEESLAWHLGNGMTCGPNIPRVDKWGSAATHFDKGLVSRRPFLPGP